MNTIISPTKKAIIFLVFLNIFLFGVYGFFFYKIEANREQIALLSQRSDIITSRERELSTFRTIVTSTKDDRKKLSSYFLHEDDIVFFIEEVESLGKQTGVPVEFSTVAITKDGGNDALRLKFVVNGSFDDVFYFFSLFELLPHALSFERVSIEKKNLLWEGNIQASILSFLGEE